MVESGMELNAVQLRRVTETLEAACATDGEVRAQLLDGTLARDVEVDDSVEVLAAGGLVEREPRRTEPGGERAHEAERAKEKEREKERERREREQRLQAVAATRGEIAELEGAAREALARLRAAQAETERARRVSEEADARLAQAREKLAKLDGSRHRS
jgi:chromosome segregation ATPase